MTYFTWQTPSLQRETREISSNFSMAPLCKYGCSITVMLVGVGLEFPSLFTWLLKSLRGEISYFPVDRGSPDYLGPAPDTGV